MRTKLGRQRTITVMDETTNEKRSTYVPDEAEDAIDPTTATPVADGETLPDGQPVGPDNIREGRVRGLMGGPNQQQGEGQGG